MAFEDYKITSADLNGKGVIGLPDAPQLSAENMQKKFEETARDVIIPRINTVLEKMDEVIPPMVLPEAPLEPQNGDMLVYDSEVGAFVFVQKATSIANLKDVDLTGLVNGMYLRYDFPTRSWKATNSSASVPALDDINDVTITSATTGQCLVYNNGTWVNDNEKLDDLNNVYIHLPQNKQFLAYDSANDRWTNVDLDGGGHKILNASGTQLAQKEYLQFGGLLKATDENGKTVVTDEAEEISFADWDALTDAQKEAYSAGKKLNILDPPDCDGEVEIELMHEAWTNPNPTSEFTTQPITLDTSDYTDYKIRFAPNRNSTANNLTSESEKGKGTVLNYSTATASGVRTFSRGVSFTDATHLTFANCTYSTGSTADITDNSSCIPIAVYVYKKKPTAKINAIATSVSTSASQCMLSDNHTSVESVVEDLTANDLGTAIDVKSYTSANPYTTQKDGYLYLGVGSGQSSLAWIKGSSSNSVLAMGGTAGFFSCFVRKGMKIYASNSPTTLNFFELS